jgi:iron complex transport system ATP-binding protein
VLVLAGNIKRDGRTLLLSLHDLRLAHCLDMVVVLHKGRLRAAGPPATVLTPALLREVFGVRAEIAPGLVLKLP